MAITPTSVTQRAEKASPTSRETRPRAPAPVDTSERGSAAPKPPENPQPAPSEGAQVRLSAEGRAKAAAQAADQKEAATAAQNVVQQRQSEAAANLTTAQGVAAYRRVFSL
jgi:hypothetical protein